MSPDIEPRYVKGLFFQLVKLVGGVEAAGAYLNVSHQRVSQLQGVGCADMPTILQVVTLERAAGVPVVTAALAELTAPGMSRKPAIVESAEAFEAMGRLNRLVVDGAPQRDIEAAAAIVQREVADVPFATGRAANVA